MMDLVTVQLTVTLAFHWVISLALTKLPSQNLELLFPSVGAGGSGLPT